MKSLIFFICLFFINLVLFAQKKPLILNDPNETINLGKYVSFLEDKEGNLSIEQIVSSEFDKKFTKSEMATLNFGIFADSYYWVKIEIQNQTFEDEWVIELPYSMFEIANWYSQNSGKWRLQKDGYAVPKAERNMQSRFPAIRLNIEKDSTQIVYLKFKANTLACPLHIESLKNYTAKHHLRDISFGAMQSIIFVIFCICLFLFGKTKKIPYIFFSLVAADVFAFSTFYDGYWKAGFANQQSQFNFIAFTLYALVFFKVKENSAKIFLVGKIVLAYFAVCLLIAYLVSVNTAALLGQINYMLMFGFVIFVAVRELRSGNKQAKLYLFGMFAQFTFVLTEVILVNSGLNRPFFNFMHLGFFAETIVFAFVLVKQSVEEQTQLQKAKEESQQENARLISEQNQILEQKVRERTESLQMANEELAVMNEELYQTQEEILAQRDALEQHSFKIGKSIEAAQIIQKAILPSKYKMADLFPEHFVIFKPKDIVSGDFWWANEILDLGFGNHQQNISKKLKYLIVADCTGHGVSGAMLTMIGSSLLDRIVLVLGIQEPAQILEKLHEEIKMALQQEKTKNSEGMDIGVLCWYAQKNDCVFSYAAAKRPLYYVLNEKIEKISGTRRNVGGLVKSTKAFQNHTFTLPKGSKIYMCSDGFADQNDKERKHFTEKMMLNLLENTQHLHLSEQKITLKTALKEHMQNTEQRDDILLIGVRV